MNHQINIDEAIANELIPVVKNIIADFNLTNNIKS